MSHLSGCGLAGWNVLLLQLFQHGFVNIPDDWQEMVTVNGSILKQMKKQLYYDIIFI